MLASTEHGWIFSDFNILACGVLNWLALVCRATVPRSWPHVRFERFQATVFATGRCFWLPKMARNYHSKTPQVSWQTNLKVFFPPKMQWTMLASTEHGRIFFRFQHHSVWSVELIGTCLSRYGAPILATCSIWALSSYRFCYRALLLAA